VLVVRYKPSVDDLVEVWRHLVLTGPTYKKARVARALMPISMTVVFTTLALSFRFEASGSPIAVAILALFIGVATWHLWRSYPDRTVAAIARHWSQQDPDYEKREVTLEVDTESITTRSSQATTTYQWSAFTDYSDLPSCIALWINRLNAVPIPKKAMTPAELTELLKIVSGHLRAA
jgi:hypothetical protein